MRHFVLLGRFLVTRSSGRSALRVGLPLYMALAIFATVIFAHSGLDASTVVRRAESSAATRLILLVAWTVATLPVFRGILTTEANLFMRSLPIRRWHLVFWLGAVMSLAELPWFVLWTRGGGAASGLGATVIALALHASLVAGVRTLIDATSIATASTAWLAPAPFGRIAVGAMIFVLATARAWRRAPELGGSAPRGRIAGSPAFALATAYSLVAIRQHGAALLRAAVIVAAGMGWAGLAVINADLAHREGGLALRIGLSGWIPSCILAVATPLGPMLRVETAAEWVLLSCGTTPGQRRAATTSLSAAAGAAIGLGVGSMLLLLPGAGLAERLPLAAVLIAAGTALSMLTETCVRVTLRGDGHDGGRVMLALFALVALAEGVMWLTY